MGFWDFLKKVFGGEPGPPPSGPGAPGPTPGPSGAPAPSDPAAAPAGGKKGRGFGAPSLLSLSPDEWRKRALAIKPWATPWIGRVDTIPPQSDERTALIDRGLILRGKLTPKELAEIHEVGDLWLEHHGKVELAEAQARTAAANAVADLRAQRAAKKAQKQKESQERKAARAAAIQARRNNDIIYLGRGVSKGLADRRANVERLNALGLPLLATPKELADLLGLDIRTLRWLAFHAEAQERCHYVRFTIKKRSGGERQLAAPHQKLKAVQKQILQKILERLDPGPDAHGFVKRRSTVTNAQAHVARHDLINLDISDFFPTIHWRRVRGLFKSFGYSPAVATIVALLVTEAPRTVAEYDGKKYWVAVGERVLPQGAPTSPALSNLISRRLDRRLAGLAQKRGWRYTRYADDLTFSAAEKKRPDIPWMMRQAKEILAAEGFVLHPNKQRVQRKGRRQTVTGIVVNQKLSVPREEVRKLRAILHGAKKTGLAAQNRENLPHFPAWLRGKLAYLAMVDPVKGKKMLAELDTLEGRTPR